MMYNKVLAYVYDTIKVFFDICSLRPKRIIVFGSFVKKDMDKESDIDLFIDCKEEDAEEIKIKFEEAVREVEKKKEWKIRDIAYPISFIADNIEKKKWNRVKREIISNGIVLFDQFREFPDNAEHYIIISYNLVKSEEKEKVRISRKLYGYSAVKNDKTYIQKGMIEKLGGSRLGKGTIIIPAEFSRDIEKILNVKGVEIRIKECWM